MKQHLFTAVFTILLFGQAFSDEKKLLFVQILFRHGDRAPIKLYPTDPNPASLWPEGLAALTNLGKKQQYALGKYFRSRYANFTTSCPLEVNVISSEVDRCLKSAESNLASFYAPDSKWSFISSLPWQPIAVRYLPQKIDKYLEVNSFCPRADEELQKIYQSAEGQKLLKEHEEMFKYLASHSGRSITSFTEANYLHDVLMIEKKYNLTVPPWVEPYWNELINVTNLSFFWNYNSPLLHRLRAGPLIQKIIETMSQKINGEIPKLKFQVYSAHDSNIAVVLDALNLFNMIAPPYCSALLFELFEMPDGVKTVRLLYQNSSQVEEKIDPPHILILEGCTEFCPLDYFVNYTRPLIPEDWDLECQVKKLPMSSLFVLLTLAMVVLGIIILTKMYTLRHDKEGFHLLSKN